MSLGLHPRRRVVNAGQTTRSSVRSRLSAPSVSKRFFRTETLNKDRDLSEIFHNTADLHGSKRSSPTNIIHIYYVLVQSLASVLKKERLGVFMMGRFNHLFWWLSAALTTQSAYAFLSSTLANPSSPSTMILDRRRPPERSTSFKPLHVDQQVQLLESISRSIAVLPLAPAFFGGVASVVLLSRGQLEQERRDAEMTLNSLLPKLLQEGQKVKVCCLTVVAVRVKRTHLSHSTLYSTTMLGSLHAP